MDMEALKRSLVRHEGRRSVVYVDSEGHPTIGVGFNLDRGDAKTLLAWVGADYAAVMAGAPLTGDQIDRLLDRTAADAVQSLRANIPGFDELPDVVQLALSDMCFNLGWPRLRCFVRTLAAVVRQDWSAMADEMLDSLWAKQVGARAQELAAEVRALAEGTDK